MQPSPQEAKQIFLLVRQKGTPKTTTPLGVIVSVKQMAETPATIFLYSDFARTIFPKIQGNVATMAL